MTGTRTAQWDGDRITIRHANGQRWGHIHQSATETGWLLTEYRYGSHDAVTEYADLTTALRAADAVITSEPG